MEPVRSSLSSGGASATSASPPPQAARPSAAAPAAPAPRAPLREILSAIVSSSKQMRSEEHTSELQSRGHLVCRLLLEKKKKQSRKGQHRARANAQHHELSTVTV